MDAEQLRDAVAAMLLPATTPAEIAAIGNMVEDDDLPDVPDEDDGPINEAAAKKLREWILARALAAARARLEGERRDKED